MDFEGAFISRNNKNVQYHGIYVAFEKFVFATK